MHSFRFWTLTTTIILFWEGLSSTLIGLCPLLITKWWISFRKTKNWLLLVKGVTPAGRCQLLMKSHKAPISTWWRWYMQPVRIFPHKLVCLLCTRWSKHCDAAEWVQAGFQNVKEFQGIIEPIPIIVKRSKYGLGYVPTGDEAKMKKGGGQALVRTIPLLY